MYDILNVEMLAIPASKRTILCGRLLSHDVSRKRAFEIGRDERQRDREMCLKCLSDDVVIKAQLIHTVHCAN